MRLFLWTTACCLAVSAADAAEFPYQAVIEAEEAYVRSGPGRESYYPTSLLQRGARVVVHRHDPGGWYMIAPPAGSFSWIRAEYVRRTGRDAGEVTENNVVVRVGSEFGDAREVEQRRLSIGDTVEILGEESLAGDGDSIRMYKIKPPKGEWRWIEGRHAVPLDPAQRRQRENDPFAPPSYVREEGARDPGPRERQVERHSPSPPDPDPFETKPLERSVQGGAVVRSAPDPDRLQYDRDRLAAIDRRFSEMADLHVSQWELDPLEMEYQHLRENAAHPALANKVNLRLDAVERYRLMKSDYDELIRLASETDRRDRELLAQRGSGTDGAVLEDRLVPLPPDPPASLSEGNADRFTSPTPSSPPSEVTGARRFDGAGIVQRAAGAAPGTPAHVLVAPNGRILAYLVAEPGIHLDQYLGREMGIHGDRGYRDELRADLLRVRSLTPVRLKR